MTALGKVTSELIENAYNKAKLVSKNLNVDLIVDGGSENNNIYVKNFIESSLVNIQKFIALKDIPYSNSMIERVNHTLKYRYLFPKKPRDLKHLRRILRYFINDYNNRRPHGQLKGLTPHEAWSDLKPDKSIQFELLKKARTERIQFKKENKCSTCI